MDLQTSADRVLLDWPNWIETGSRLDRGWIEAEFAALRYFALSRSNHRSHAEQDDAIAGSIRLRNYRGTPSALRAAPRSGA